MARTDFSHAAVSSFLASLKDRAEACAKAANTIASPGFRCGCCAAVSIKIARSLAVRVAGAVNRNRVAAGESVTMFELDDLRPRWIIFLFPKTKIYPCLAGLDEPAFGRLRGLTFFHAPRPFQIGRRQDQRPKWRCYFAVALKQGRRCARWSERTEDVCVNAVKAVDDGLTAAMSEQHRGTRPDHGSCPPDAFH
jgi:hypothetical protein